MDNYDIALQRATEVLGDKERATDWLEKMSRTLCCPPRDLLSTQEGLDQVLRHLHSVDIALNTD